MSRGPEAPVVGRCAFALRDPCGQVLVARSPCGTLARQVAWGEKKKEVLELSRELGELDACWTDDAWGCVGRR